MSGWLRRGGIAQRAWLTPGVIVTLRVLEPHGADIGWYATAGKAVRPLPLDYHSDTL